MYMYDGGPSLSKEYHVSVHLQPCYHHVVQGQHPSSDIIIDDIIQCGVTDGLCPSHGSYYNKSQGLILSSALPPILKY